MRIAVISDLHSNLEALTACRERAQLEGAERFVCLGDCVGYGPDPAPTLDLLLSLPNLKAVIGNHDESLLVSMPELPDSHEVHTTVAWTLSRLLPKHLDFFKSLPYSLVDDGVTYVHASAARAKAWEYVTTPAQAQECLEATETFLTFIGHVHVPMLFEEATPGAVHWREVKSQHPVTLLPRRRYLVNVGSVGQPRDGRADASFVLYDNAREQITFHRVPYEHARTAQKIRAAGLPPYFAERLATGS
jgi:diadenosine tetraphosphatase ApaH/serine/threonine PP2A family protein phosphatase